MKSKHDEDQHAVESRAHTAKDHFAQHDVDQRNQPSQGINESCIEFTAPQLASVVTVAKSAELAMPKRTSLPSMLPPACEALYMLIDPMEQRIRLRLGIVRNGTPTKKNAP